MCQIVPAPRARQHNSDICLLSTLKKRETPYFYCFGSALFPEMRDRQYETQFKQLHQPNLQDALTGSEDSNLSLFVP